MAKDEVADQQQQKGVGRSCLLSGNFLDSYPTRNKHCTFEPISELFVSRALFSLFLIRTLGSLWQMTN